MVHSTLKIISVLAVPALALSVPAFAQTGGTKPIYGAIAYSVTKGNVGYAWNKATRAVASQGAIDECKASDCRVVTEFWGRCGALAVGSKGYGAAHGETQAASQGWWISRRMDGERPSII